MSSELILYEVVAAGAIETLFDGENKPWFKRANPGRYLGIQNIRDNFKDFPFHLTRTRSEIESVGVSDDLSGMRGGGKNPHDAFVNLDGALEIAVRSRKPKAVALVNWLAKKGVEKLEEDHQKAIEERDSRIQAIEYENVGLQGEIRNARRTITNLLENRHVARCGEYDNILVGVQKNKPIEDDGKKSRHAFDMMRCQKRRKGLLMARLKKEYPYMSEKRTCEDPNAVHRWCWFKEDVLREDKYYQNHFSLDTLTKREFEELFGIYMD